MIKYFYAIDLYILHFKMEMLRSSFQAVGLSSGDSDNKSGAPSSAETIERLVSRLNTSTLLEDRRDACRALKGRYLPITF